MGEVSFKPGWLNEQLDQVERSIEEWPDWLRRDVGMGPKPASVYLRAALNHAHLEPSIASVLKRALRVQLQKESKPWEK